eukprot:1161589-Pelagomonas_calceolata.AAC.9
MGCAGWPKQGFDRALGRCPGHPNSSSPLSWRFYHVAAAPTRAQVWGKKCMVLPAQGCATTASQDSDV